MNIVDISVIAEVFRNNPKSILFVTSQLRPRELKMADGLRKCGWFVGLLFYKWTPFDPEVYFDFAIETASPQEAHAWAKRMAPPVTHVFSGAIDDFVLLFCRDKPSPVVIDLNDVFAPSLFDYCHERFEPTREALALADGFCARDLQVKSAEKTDRFKLPRHLILFPEYCWQVVPSETVPEKEPDEVHVVSVGTFSLETQGMYDSCYLELTKRFIAQSIHFHIYPHWAYRRDHSGSPNVKFEEDFADFILLAKESTYLHLHESLPIEELAKVLPGYDFGVVSGGSAELGQTLRFYHRAYLNTCYSGRISDYLDARLPVIVNDEVKFDYWLLKRYGVCVDLKGLLEPNFKMRLMARKNDPAQRTIMEQAVKNLSVEKNAVRLSDFYDRVAGRELHQFNQEVVHVLEVIPLAQPKAATQNKINWLRWLRPRLAKIVLPYRAIRIFEVRLHNALQEVDRQSRERHALQSVLSEQEVVMNQLTGAIQTTQADLIESNRLLELSRLYLDQKEVVINQFTETIQSAQVDLIESNRLLELSRSQNMELSADKHSLSTRVQDFQETIVAQCRQFEELEITVECVKRDLERKCSEILSLTSNLQLSQQQSDTLHTEAYSLQSSLARMEQQHISLCAQLQALQTDYKELDTTRETLAGRLAITEQSLQLQMVSASALAEEKKQLDDKLENLRINNVDVQIAYAQLRERLLFTEDARVATNAKLDALQIEYVALRNSWKEMGHARDTWAVQVSVVEQERQCQVVEIDGLKQEKNDLLIRIAARDVDHNELRRRLTSAESFSDLMRQQLSELEQEKLAAASISDRERLLPAVDELCHRLASAVGSETFAIIDEAPKLLIACMPKSGSTWLTAVLEEQLGLHPRRAYLEADRNEQEIDPIALFQSWGERTLFVQQHIRYARISHRILKAFSTKIVVLTRRLDDVVVSLCDHVENESAEAAMFYMEREWYMGKTREQRIDFIIDHAMPWYINFYLGWQQAIKHSKQDILFVCYEDLIADSAACVERIAEFYGSPLHDLTAINLDRRAGTRFNQGRVGRGKEILTLAQRKKLRALSSHYPACDFSSIGLD
ncbi:MAG: sulfotransferase family protein [Rhodocyclales bacterium]|nr:sulfotransferase family protein [Rhodocyclales bacterium]